jgi:hypothetical protein
MITTAAAPVLPADAILLPVTLAGASTQETAEPFPGTVIQAVILILVIINSQL